MELTESRPRRAPIGATGVAPGADVPIFQLRDVIRVYREADVETIALRGVDLDIARGESVAIVGRSGSGKSTLLNLMAGADRPTAGTVRFLGRDLATADDAARAAVRGSKIGIVYQAQNLAPMLSLLENVRLATWLCGRPLDATGARAALARVGLDDFMDRRPAHLSGGEQQRAALGCVLAARPTALLADEITGELDRENARRLLDLLVEARDTDGTTVVLVTHDREAAATADRIVELRDGRVVGEAASV